jgi:hypothetical protein
MFQEENSIFWEVTVSVIFWEVTVSVIVSEKMYMYMRPVQNDFRDRAVSLLIRKRYYVLFLIPVFIAQVTKLVQFT